MGWRKKKGLKTGDLGQEDTEDVSGKSIRTHGHTHTDTSASDQWDSQLTLWVAHPPSPSVQELRRRRRRRWRC